MGFYDAPREVAPIYREAEARGWFVGAHGKTTACPDTWRITYRNTPSGAYFRPTFAGELVVAGTDEACIQGCKDALKLLEDDFAARIAETVA